MNVSKAFSFQEYSAIATRNVTNFSDFGDVVTTPNCGYGDTYTYANNNANVLAVAHLDTVQQGAWSSLIRLPKSNENVLVSPRLDDRLGVYIITKLLPKLGIKTDWLLTIDEEIGASSAAMFETNKQYKWAFSFDRAGTDVVLYQFDNKALRRILRKNGFHVGHGSFSDLSSLDIGCSGINFGCGYQDAHSISSYAILSDTFLMVERFIRFYSKYQNIKLPYNPRARWERLAQPWYHRAYWPEYSAQDEYLDWTLEHLSQDERLEQIADQAQSTGELQ